MKKILLCSLFLLGNLGATDWYVRTDGGTRTECTGLTDAAYPGSGTAQDCAFEHPFWLVTDNHATTPTWAWIISSGDTVYIGTGQYRMGHHEGGVGTDWKYCTLNSFFNACVMPKIPSGISATQRTRILGTVTTPVDGGTPQVATYTTGYPELYGVMGANWILSNFDFGDKSNSKWIEIGYLDFTDHMACRVAPSGATAGNICTTAVGDWGGRGLNLHGWEDSYLHDVNVHGFAGAGIFGGKWRGVNTVERIMSDGNAFGGWDMDSGATLGTGTFFAGAGNIATIDTSEVWIRWNGCIEAYPVVSGVPVFEQCMDDADGFSTAPDNGIWTIHKWVMLYNTSDNFDGNYFGASPLYDPFGNPGVPFGCDASTFANAQTCTAGWIYDQKNAYPTAGVYENPASGIVTDSWFEGAIGNQVKLGGSDNSTLRNSVVIGNCDFWNGTSTVVPPSNPDLTLANLLDPNETGVNLVVCRGAGVPAIVAARPGGVMVAENNTILTTSSDGLHVVCATRIVQGWGYSNDCGNTGGRLTPATIRNNIIHTPYVCTVGAGCGNGAGIFYDNGQTAPDNSTPASSRTGGSRSNNLIWNFYYASSPDCGAAGTTDEICSVSVPVFVDISGELADADINLVSGSPAIDAGVTIVATTPDYDGVSRPQGADYDLGALEFVSGSSLAVSPTSISNIVVGAACPSPFTASGGSSPYTFTLDAGSLPSGCTLNTDGTVSGTTDTVEAVSFTIGAEDSGMITGSRAYSFSVTGVPGVVKSGVFSGTISPSGQISIQ